MSKLILFIAIFTLSLSTLSSAVYKSNALGQRLEEAEEVKNDGWYLLVNENSSVLYNSGEAEEKREWDDNRETILYSDGSERITLYRPDGLIESITEKDSSSTIKYVLIYDELKLQGYDLYENDTLKKKIQYVTFSGRLISLKGDERAIFSDSFYAYRIDGEDVIVKESNDGEKTLEKGEDGLFRDKLIIDGIEVEKVFDDDLNLLSEIYPDYSVQYSYEGSALKEKKTIKENEEISEEYKSGKLYMTVYSKNGNIERVRTILADGNIEEIRYISLKPRYRFLYAADGIKLLEAEAL